MSNRKWQCENVSCSFLDGMKSQSHHCDITSQQHDVCHLSSRMKECVRDFATCTLCKCVCMGMPWERFRQPDQSPDTEGQMNEKRERMHVCVWERERGNPCLSVWGFSSKKELQQLHKHTNTLVVLPQVKHVHNWRINYARHWQIKTKTSSLVKLKLLTH